VASPSSSVTALRPRSRRPRTQSGRRCETPSLTLTADRRLSGLLWLVCRNSPPMSKKWLSSPQHNVDQLLITCRCLHPSWMCPHWRGRRLRRLVLPLPRFPLRYLWPHKKGPSAAQPRSARIRLPRGGQGDHRLESPFVHYRNSVRMWKVGK
jgi:hypothetical protein